MPFHMGPIEIGIILVLVLIIFGVGKLPQVGSALGKSIKEFRKEKAGVEEDKNKEKDVAKSTEVETKETSQSSAS